MIFSLGHEAADVRAVNKVGGDEALARSGDAIGCWVAKVGEAQGAFHTC